MADTRYIKLNKHDILTGILDEESFLSLDYNAELATLYNSKAEPQIIFSFDDYFTEELVEVIELNEEHHSDFDYIYVIDYYPDSTFAAKLPSRTLEAYSKTECTCSSWDLFHGLGCTCGFKSPRP